MRWPSSGDVPLIEDICCFSLLYPVSGSAFVEDVAHALAILFSEPGISTNIDDGMRLLSTAAVTNTFSGGGSGIATPGT